MKQNLIQCIKEDLRLNEAWEIAGGLTKPTKLPCYSYDIPIESCQTGTKLMKVKGSVCICCYGGGGWYPARRYKQQARLRQLKNPLWTEAMIFLINHFNQAFFRWHDIGDIQGLWHLQKIFDVCLGTPDTWHWLPTHEHLLIRKALEDHKMIKPPNLNIQLSANMLDEMTGSLIKLARKLGCTVSGVSTDGRYSCPAPDQFNSCQSCRQCWNPNHFITIFKYHGLKKPN